MEKMSFHFGYRNLLIGLLTIVVSLYAMNGAAQKVEAESGTLTGTNVASTRAGFSGTGYVTGFDNENDAVTMKVTISKAGLYELSVGYAAPYGDKYNDIYINGDYAGSMSFPEKKSFTEDVFGKVNLNQGENTVKVLKSWGYFELDYISLTPAKPNEIHHYKDVLNNPNASDEAQLIYRFLRDYYGHKIISGQQASDGASSEIIFLESKTGKKPAIKGLDLIDYSPSRVANGTTSKQTEYTVDWWEQESGLVSQMWHWNAPKNLLNTNDAPWWSGFYTYATTFDPTIAMNNTASEEYQLIIRDIDVIAEELKVMKDANVPVLWRPLHEAEGGWFWWGAKGPAACVWLWKLMYDRLTNYHELNNLIWVWTGTNSESALDWYPGDEYVDIVGADIYLNDKNYSSNFSQFDGMVGLHEGQKVITLSETGIIPDPDALDGEKARWSWFCVWAGDFITGGAKNELSHINMVYNHDYVITLDELPDFENYVSPDFPDEEVEEETALSVSKNEMSIVYPNPTTDFIQLKDMGEPVLIDVFDVDGKHLMHLWNDQQQQLDVRQLPSGIYILKIVGRSGPKASVKFQKL